MTAFSNRRLAGVVFPSRSYSRLRYDLAMVHPSRVEPWLKRNWALAVVIALLPAWTVGVCTRSLWKPDEPREAAIAARMTRPGADWAVPHLGATAFCEKPPLTYWVAASSARLLGPGVVPLRLPNLAFGLAGALLVGYLAMTIRGPVAGLTAGLLFGTTYLTYRVGVWLATDALLMWSVAGALLGCLRGLKARRGAHKFIWYGVMHFFLGCGFLTKNVLALVVPALAWLTVVIWERRWRELVIWEFLLPVTVQVAMIAPWLLAVGSEPEGATYLRIFFRNNILGRFTPIEGVGYTESHPGWPGKYLSELPVYLFPWTLLGVAAAATAWRRCRGLTTRPTDPGAEDPTGWRFAVGAIVPPLLLLSASASMRDVYAGILMPGCALLGGLWVAAATEEPRRLDLAMLQATSTLIGVLTLLVPPAVAVVALHFNAPILPLAIAGLVVAWLAGIAVASAGWLAVRARRTLASFLASAFIAALSVPALAPLVVPMMNRAQDLRPVAAGAVELAACRPLALWQPDETIIAVMDFEAGLTPLVVRTPEAAASTLAAHADTVFLAKVDSRPDQAVESNRSWAALGLETIARIELPEPGGRKYLVLGRPAHVPLLEAPLRGHSAR